MSFPMLENLKLIRDQNTNKTFSCTANKINLPWKFRTSIAAVPTANGGIDARAGQRNFLAPRAISVNLVHVYGTGESFKTVMNALEQVIVPGNPLELQTEEEDGTVWLWQNVRLEEFNKTHALDWAHYCEIPLTFTAPDPTQRALYKSDLFYLDNGLLLNDGWFLDDDPDSFALSGSPQDHTISNVIAGLPGGADEAPIVTLTGAITGPILVTYFDDTGNVIAYWYYTVSIAAGETVTVDAEQLEVTSTLTGSTAYGNFILGDGVESWGRINGGATLIRFTYAGFSSPAAARIIWTNHK